MEIPYTQFEDFDRTLAESEGWYHEVKHPNYDRRDPTDDDVRAAHWECRKLLGAELYQKYLGKYQDF